jgi:hypothetical protein
VIGWNFGDGIYIYGDERLVFRDEYLKRGDSEIMLSEKFVHSSQDLNRAEGLADVFICSVG